MFNKLYHLYFLFPQASLEQLSQEFNEAFKDTQQMNQHYQEIWATRCKLPAFAKKAEIMDAIADNQIILIQGETGSGKTTQVDSTF